MFKFGRARVRSKLAVKLRLLNQSDTVNLRAGHSLDSLILVADTGDPWLCIRLLDPETIEVVELAPHLVVGDNDFVDWAQFYSAEKKRLRKEGVLRD